MKELGRQAARALERFRPWLPDAALVLAVFCFTLVYRLVNLEPIEIGGDALNKWHFAKQWAHVFDLREVNWNHHVTRFGVTLPLGLLQLVMGRDALGYHVAAVLASTAVGVFVYLAGRLAHGPLVGVAAAVWATTFPSWKRAGSQISPDNFGSAWVALAVVLLLVHVRRDKTRLGWLIASASALFGAYLAKEPFVFFIPGMILAVFLMTRSLRSAAIYAAVPVALLAVETVFYRSVSQYSSRFGVVSESHGEGLNRIKRFLDVFKRYENLVDAWYWLLVPALIGALALPFLSKDKRRWVVILAPASFFFFYTFAIRRLDPLTLWTRMLTRYLDPGVPFAALLASLFLVVLAARLLARLPSAARLLARTSHFTPWLLAALLGVLAVGTYLAKPIGSSHPFLQTPRYSRILTEAYRRGIPIVTRKGGQMSWKALKAAFMVYIDDRELLVDGKLLRFAEIYDSDRIMVKKGAPKYPSRCVVRVWTRDRFLVVDPKASDLRDCRPLEPGR